MIWDDLTQYTQGLKYKLILQKPDGTELFSIPESYEKTFTGSLKDVDEFSFSLPYYLDTGEPNPHWDKIKTGYNLYIRLEQPETEEYFYESRFKIISMNNISTEDGILKKEIYCKSLEIELSRKIISLFKGSKVIYRFQHEIDSWSASSEFPTKQSFIDSGILNVICNINNGWSVNESLVDSSYNGVYRFMDVDSQACLDFLLNVVQSSFSCLFTFNCITRQIGCKNIINLGNFKGLFLSDNNYIIDHTEEIDDSDIVTKLYMYGSENLNFRSKNITGEDYILDLSYYRNLDYMSQSLMDSLDAYDTLLESKNGDFASLLSNLNTYTSNLSVQKSALTLLETQLKTLEIALDELKEEKADLTSKNIEIAAKNAEISAKNAEIATTNANITSVTASIEALQTEILISNNFSLEEISELDQFIFERKSVDDTFVDAGELLEEAKKIITKTNQPRIAFQINIVNLYGIVEDPTLWTKITMGDIGVIKLDKFKTDVELRILGFVFKEDENDLSLSFANKYNINDPSMTAKLIESTISTTTSLDTSKYKILTKDSSEYSAIEASVYGDLDLSARTAKAGNNQGISINEHGIVCTNLAYPQEIMQLLNSGLYLTNDGFQTAKVAIDANGVNAEVVRGALGEFATLKAEQVQLNDDGSGLSEIGIKVSHIDGSYTSMESDGFSRYMPVPIYSESPTGVPNIENFTGKTISGLQTEGWEFGGSYSMGTNELLIGNLTSVQESYVRIIKYITKENSSFTFTYRNYVDSEGDADYYFYIDDTRYNLSSSGTNISFPSSGVITLSEGWHTFQWHCNYRMSISNPSSPNGLYMYIDSVVFEQNPYMKTVIGTDIVGSTYSYMVDSGTGTTQLGYNSGGKIYSRYEGAIPDVWVQLSDQWKGKNFKISVFLQDTGDVLSDGLATVKIKVVNDSIDYANARFKVKAVTQRVAYDMYNFGSGITGFASVRYYQGCDFTYVVIA
jgi:predicted  nucleic acid-binding Zn-ribbon protein